MQITFTITLDSGETITVERHLDTIDSTDVLRSVEQTVCKLQTELGTILSEELVKDHQAGFVGEKNQEEKRDA
jgi:hypothetical protein